MSGRAVVGGGKGVEGGKEGGVKSWPCRHGDHPISQPNSLPIATQACPTTTSKWRP